ncbi:MAG: hypothetical protein ABR583_03640 [Gaiellaceae bacterium]
MHLRPPSIDHGVASFLWGFGLGIFLWIGMVLIGVSPATAFIFGALGGAAIFLFVRHFGEERRGQATSSRTRMP